MKSRVFLTSICGAYNKKNYFMDWASQFESIFVEKNIYSDAMDLSTPKMIIKSVLLEKYRIHKIIIKRTLYYEV
jgi:hypothetical protein